MPVLPMLAPGFTPSGLVSITGWFLKCFFSLLLGCSLGCPEAWGSMRRLSLCLRGCEVCSGWLETPGLLWGQGQLVQEVKGNKTAFAPTASLASCTATVTSSKEVFYKAGPYL